MRCELIRIRSEIRYQILYLSACRSEADLSASGGLVRLKYGGLVRRICCGDLSAGTMADLSAGMMGGGPAIGAPPVEAQVMVGRDFKVSRIIQLVVIDRLKVFGEAATGRNKRAYFYP